MVGKVSVSMGDNSVKNSQIKILTPYSHLHIIGRKSTKFQVTPQRQDLSDGRKDGGNNTHGRTRVISIVPLRLCQTTKK